MARSMQAGTRRRKRPSREGRSFDDIFSLFQLRPCRSCYKRSGEGERHDSLQGVSFIIARRLSHRCLLARLRRTSAE